MGSHETSAAGAGTVGGTQGKAQQQSEGVTSVKIAFFSKANFATNVSTLRRRLSNENVTSPYDDRLDKIDPAGNLAPTNIRSRAGSITSPRDSPIMPNAVSNEASPMKEQPASKKAAFMGKVSMFSKVVSAKVDLAKDKADALKHQGTLNKKRCFTLLVIADPNIDWSKWFRGKKIHTDWDIRVEQCEFKDLTVSASSEEGICAGIITIKSGTRTVNLLKPDFLLIRQDPRDAGEDFKSVLLGFQYGQVRSINSLQSIYNFQDKPWVYAHLLGLQKKLGKENFPLIEQAFYQNHKEIVHKGSYPCVFKIGHAHGGLGKVKVDTAEGFQDLKGVVAVSSQYCTVEELLMHIVTFTSTRLGPSTRHSCVSPCLKGGRRMLESLRYRRLLSRTSIKSG